MSYNLDGGLQGFEGTEHHLSLIFASGTDTFLSGHVFWIFIIRVDRGSNSQVTESESVAAFRDSAGQMANDYFYSLFLHYMQKYLLTL